jgi:multimeric flavodoxin WrbA
MSAVRSTPPGGRSFLFLLASMRRGGNTEQLARVAAAGIPAEVEQQWVRLADQPLAPFTDVRHEGDGVYPAPEGAERLLLEATLAASDIVVATPMYWYSITAAAKLYLDYWSAWLRVPGVDFKARMRGKTMWAVTAHTCDDPAMIEPLVGTLRYSAEYLAMRWGGVLLGYANRPGDITSDPGAAARAATFFGPAEFGPVDADVVEQEPVERAG